MLLRPLALAVFTDDCKEHNRDLLCSGLLDLGRTMNDYEELEELSARGAERVVKLHKERASGRTCVVRTIPTAKLHADKLRSLWCKRIELLHRLRGPGLARINVVFFDGDALYEEFA